jgi:hypothetical protein
MSTNPYEPSQTAAPMAAAVELPTEIEYDITLDDLVAFFLDFGRRSTVQKVAIGCTGLVMTLPVPGGISVYLLTAKNLNPEDVIALLSLAAVYFVLVAAISIWCVVRGPRGFLMNSYVRYLLTRGDTRSLVGRHTLRISSSDITERGPQAEHRFAMSAVQKLVLSRDNLYIYVSPVQAIVVPARAFEHAAMREGLVRTLEQYAHVNAIR